MSASRRSPAVPTEIGAAAIRYLADHGFESTTAGELADAVGMSRSTFFRRFGSKDDVIFVDHELALEQLDEFLRTTDLPIADALTRATVDVLHRLTHDVEAAGLRSELLRRTPALRERELVITYRYERLYANYLSDALGDQCPTWVPVALSAALVAVHNAALRRWLRDPDPRAAGALDAELRALIARFSPWVQGTDRSRVVVAAFDAVTSPEAVLRAVEDHLR